MYVCLRVCMYYIFFFELERKEIGGRRWDDMSCVPRLFGLCMYTLRGTGGLEEEGGREGGFVRRAWFFLGNIPYLPVSRAAVRAAVCVVYSLESLGATGFFFQSA